MPSSEIQQLLKDKWAQEVLSCLQTPYQPSNNTGAGIPQVHCPTTYAISTGFAPRMKDPVFSFPDDF
jgi:hypothetical protein